MSAYTRSIMVKPAHCIDVQTDDMPGVGARDWLAAKANEHELKWLLAHADDGVIWGRMDDDGLVISNDAVGDNATAAAVCPVLRESTLIQARLFAEKAELFLWRDGDNGWNARLIQDVEDEETPDWIACFDEPQMLWGTHGAHLSRHFTLLEEGIQGIAHAVPISLDLRGEAREATPPVLVVRHYIKTTGFARVVARRLVDLRREEVVSNAVQ